MVTSSSLQVRPWLSGLFRLLIVLVVIGGLAALGLGFFRSLLIMTIDGGGPYHNTSDVADLEGDGDLDVILVNLRQESESTLWHQITLWTNRGGGRFTSQLFQTPPFLYLSAAAGDLDKDGDADLMLLRSDGLELYLNQGGDQGGVAGEFKRHGFTGPSQNTGTPGSIVLGDLDRNGSLDGFVAGCCSMFMEGHDSYPDLYLPSISWAWVSAWTPESWLQGEIIRQGELDDLRMRDAALGDVDGDDDLDVYAAHLAPRMDPGGDAADRVLLNDGSGSFHDSGQRLGDTDSFSVALGDIDGDSDLDALVGKQDGAAVWINQGGGAGEYVASGQELPWDETHSVALADFDGDGNLDALVAGIKQASVWLNDGQGRMALAPPRFRYSERHALAVGDFNDDGYMDIFAAAYTEAYSLWLNRGDGTFRIGKLW